VTENDGQLPLSGVPDVYIPICLDLWLRQYNVQV